LRQMDSLHPCVYPYLVGEEGRIKKSKINK